MTRKVSLIEGTDFVLVRANWLDECPEDCTLYRADLFKGFTLSRETDILGMGVKPCVSSLSRVGDEVKVLKREFVGGVLRLGWVTMDGFSIFRWYLLDSNAAGEYFVSEVREFVQRKKGAVQFQTILVPESR